MNQTPSYKPIHASVRPGRVAVLVDKDDSDWGHTCLRIIEFYTRTWGGGYNLIIPTDGLSIDRRFWTILERFDPDYLYYYHKSGKDLKLSNPEKYDELVASHTREYVQKFGTTDADRTKREIDSQLERAWFPGITIAPSLQSEVKRRLTPFYFEEHAISAGAISADSSPTFPLTDVTRIIANTSHSDRIGIIRQIGTFLPTLWYAAVSGMATPSMLSALQQVGITPFESEFGEENLSALVELIMTGAIRRPRAMPAAESIPYDLEGILPFHLSLAQLGLYRSIHYRDAEEPVLAIAGNTFGDFALYYCLSRLRDRVLWVLPSITDKALASATGEASRAELNFVSQLLLEELSSQTSGRIACLSYSLSPDQLNQVIEALNLLGIRRFQQNIQKNDNIDEMLQFPLIATERDNFQRDIAVQFVGDLSIVPFNTPKPKQFDPIDPREHRWVTQLSVPGEQPPKHFQLGTWTIPDRRLTSHEARIGRDGPAYFCPSVAYFGGDIDTVLVRPRLMLPPLSSTLKHLASQQGYECRSSDKGIYSEESVRKWGDLYSLAEFVRDSSKRDLLEKFLDTKESKVGEGVFLKDDRRRYLDFTAIKAITGTAATRIIDELILKQVLYRGLILGCSFCRNSVWYPMGSLSQQFTCRRCGRTQTYVKDNWKMPDEPSWFYKLDELVNQGYRNSMAVSLLALDYLRRNSNESFTYTTDREFFKPDAPKPDAEVDFICCIDGTLTIGEAKTDDVLGKSPTEENALMSKYRLIAEGLGARHVVIATIQEQWKKTTVEMVTALFRALPQVTVRFLTGADLLGSG